jgi:hypothetical protein
LACARFYGGLVRSIASADVQMMPEQELFRHLRCHVGRL